jgi:hypothetical protein
MNWLKKYVTLNNLLRLTAGVVAGAGAIVAAPIALPAAVVAVATKVVVYGTLAGVVAAKLLPGNFKNAPDAIKDAPTP